MLLIGERIQEYRKSANLTQEEFAAKVGVTRQAVSKWELDKAYPDLDKLADICGIFQVSLTEFIYGKPEPVPQEGSASETETKPVSHMRGKAAFVRLYGMAVLLGGILVFCGVVFAVFLFRYSWSKEVNLSERARIERVHQQYTKADLRISDDVGRIIVKTMWLDADGIREGDYIECYTNGEQDGIFYDYHIRTLAVLLGLMLLFLILFLLCVGEIIRFCRENRWQIVSGETAKEISNEILNEASNGTSDEKEEIERT
ncbi:MAG: helix-turn-helix transcriptional regulator [Acetatifactor sp.]|nr:helix-turn-helix transcriptional regulator [Acetatifactor sp.]